MISVREMHLKNPGEAVSLARQEYDRYKSADNQPGDASQKVDRVELSDGKGSNEALLAHSWTRFEVIERTRDEAGNESIRCYNGPKGLFSSSMTGFEVSRTANGSFSGSELKFIPGFDSDGFYSSDNLAPARAEQQFHQYEARFNAEFNHKA